MSRTTKIMLAVLLLLIAAAVAYFTFKDKISKKAKKVPADFDFGPDDDNSAKQVLQVIKNYDPGGLGWRLDQYQQLLDGTQEMPADKLILGRKTKTAAMGMVVGIWTPEMGAPGYRQRPDLTEEQKRAYDANEAAWKIGEAFKSRQLEKYLL